MKEDFKTKKRQWIFYLAIVASFLAILVYNCLTPPMSDELMPGPTYHSLFDLFRAEYENYMTWNGRTVVQMIMRCFLIMPKGVFNVCNSICFVVLMLLIYWNIEGRKQYDVAAYVLINLMVWQFGVSFDQTVLWESGACNYLWGSTIILGFVTLYRYQTKHSTTNKYSIWVSVGLFFFGVLGGWCNENTSGGGLLLVLFFAAVFYYHNKKWTIWSITGICGMLTGLLFMVMAPGNRLRGALMKEDEEHSGIMAYVGRFLKINTAINTYLFLMLAVTIILVVFLILRGKKWWELQNAVVYAIVSIMTAYALILTSPPMDRAYFGAGIFMTIACVQAIWYIPKEEMFLTACKYGGIIVFSIAMFFSYFENGADLVRIRREIDEREAYIVEQKAQGNYNLTVPMLRPEFQTRYSFLFKNDVDEDPESWGCSLYREYYDLESLVGVPRSEWTEY